MTPHHDGLSLKAYEDSWQQIRLPNGIRITHIPVSGDQRFCLSLLFKAGSRADPISGTAHFLEHMMFRGSKHHPSFAQLAHAFDGFGGEWNGATGHDHTEYTYEGSLRHSQDVLRLFFDFIHGPQLQDLEKERSVILREIEDETNEHEQLIDLDHHTMNAFWPQSSLAMPVFGTPKTVKQIQMEDLQTFRNTHYQPDNLGICLVGGKDSHLHTLRDLFSNYALENRQTPHEEKSLPPLEGPRCLVVEHSDNQFQVQLSFIGEGEWSNKGMSYAFIASILGDGFCSRLPYRMREELGFVYDISAQWTLMRDVGILDITASVNCEDISAFLKELCSTLKHFRENGITAEECQRTQNRLLSQMDLLPLQQGYLAHQAAWYQLHERRYNMADLCRKILAMTPETIHKELSHIFDPRKCALVLLGPSASSPENLEDLLLSSL